MNLYIAITSPLRFLSFWFIYTLFSLSHFSYSYILQFPCSQSVYMSDFFLTWWCLCGLQHVIFLLSIPQTFSDGTANHKSRWSPTCTFFIIFQCPSSVTGINSTKWCLFLLILPLKCCLHPLAQVFNWLMVKLSKRMSFYIHDNELVWVLKLFQVHQCRFLNKNMILSSIFSVSSWHLFPEIPAYIFLNKCIWNFTVRIIRRVLYVCRYIKSIILEVLTLYSNETQSKSTVLNYLFIYF